MKNLIREIRRQKDITQKQLADAIGVTVGAISQYENGSRIPTFRRAVEISKALDIPESEVAGFVREITGSNVVLPADAVDILIVRNFDVYFERLMIRAAGGKCELCQSDAPFVRRNGLPHLKIYEVKDEDLKNEQPDRRCVALCPNCYARLEVLEREEDLARVADIAKGHSIV